MKVIVSHDVDHITLWEHTNDLIVPKFYVRSALELLKGKITRKELSLRVADLWRNQWQHIEEVMHFNESMGINSCFFLGMANGKGLSYPLHYTEDWIPKIMERGFEVGVHGIAFNDPRAMQKEYDDFKRISGLQQFGIRMHYLRQDASTFEHLEKVGYRFDATERGYCDPYKKGALWEFPLQEMDGWAMCGENRFQAHDLEQAMAHTFSSIDRAEKAGLTYFSLLFHDRYFTDSFATWKAWYKAVLNELKARGHAFVTHQQALDDLA